MVRLLELRIRNFRGIRDLTLAIAGQNSALLGPNGSGKSSVVDALDFLLTGRIQRLTGQGTGTITLAKHGPHLSSKAADASVEADFQCGEASKPVTVKRTMDAPDDLVTPEGTTIPPSLAHYCSLAKDSGLHLLTRRQILDFILAEPAKRSEQVAALLRTEALDTLRKELQGAEKLAVQNVNKLIETKGTQSQALLRVFRDPTASLSEVLVKINAHRKSMGADSLESLASEGVLTGVTPLAKSAANPLQSQRVKSALTDTATWAKGGQQSWITDCDDYLNAVRSFRQHTERIRTLRALKLVESGLALVDGNHCPLCLKEWEQQELADLLSNRLEEGKDALAEATTTETLRKELRSKSSAALVQLRVLITDLGESFALQVTELKKLATSIEMFIETSLPSAVDGELPTEAHIIAVRNALIHPQTWSSVVPDLVLACAALPDLTDAQRAWDELTGAKRQLAEIESTTSTMRKSVIASAQLTLVHQAFIRARDEVLQQVYNEISTRFTAFYGAVHKHDDDGFAASLEPTRAGLKLEVGFHGRGAFPPTALHSEGHQDSMGLCLFLALVEHLSSAGAGPLLLDDVIMSVDREHRRGVANLLAAEFANTQFLLTTHDRVWWNQLRTVGLVFGKHLNSFRSWSLENGPSSEAPPILVLNSAKQALDSGDVPTAAHAIRRIVEMIGSEMYDSLGASIRYRADGGWSAGEYMDAAIGRYRALLKKSKAAANSWNQDMTMQIARDAALVDANKILGGERWAVNAVVHFNEWAELTPNDFRPVLDAHEVLLKQFVCESCEGSLYLVEDANGESLLRCLCGTVSLNLVAKK